MAGAYNHNITKLTDEFMEKLRVITSCMYLEW